MPIKGCARIHRLHAEADIYIHPCIGSNLAANSPVPTDPRRLKSNRMAETGHEIMLAVQWE
eukprot:scaffold117029_cov40-Prasinocladus_malaysianus.AAC.1